MDITEFVQGKKFLKAELVKEKGKIDITIIGEAKKIHNEKYDTDRIHIPVKSDSEELVFDCSKTNAKKIADVLGSETTEWLNAKLTLTTYQTKTSDGKLVPAIDIDQVTA